MTKNGSNRPSFFETWRQMSLWRETTSTRQKQNRHLRWPTSSRNTRKSLWNRKKSPQSRTKYRRFENHTPIRILLQNFSRSSPIRNLRWKYSVCKRLYFVPNFSSILLASVYVLSKIYPLCLFNFGMGGEREKSGREKKADFQSVYILSGSVVFFGISGAGVVAFKNLEKNQTRIWIWSTGIPDREPPTRNSMTRNSMTRTNFFFLRTEREMEFQFFFFLRTKFFFFFANQFFFFANQ